MFYVIINSYFVLGRSVTMRLVQLSSGEFNAFANNTLEASFYQSEAYASFMQERNYYVEFVGLKDEYERLLVASLIGFKKIDDKFSFGYAPKGFLLDYFDKNIIEEFSEKLVKYYKNRNIIFIKINPNIVVAKFSKARGQFVFNNNIKVVDFLAKKRFQELKNNKNFEAVLPKYNALIDLHGFNFNNLDKNVRNKISKAYRKGLSIELKGFEGIEELYPLIKNKTKKDISYYESLYRSFGKKGMIDLFLVKVDFEEFLINTKYKYQRGLDRNNFLVQMLGYIQDEKTLKRKLQADKELDVLKEDIIKATRGLANSKKKVIAGAMVIRYRDKASIVVAGYDKEYRDCNAFDYLYFKLVEYYKLGYNYLDLNGFSGDMSESSPYYGLNKFKMGFKPEVWEDIGEFDMVINNKYYKKFAGNGTLSKVFKNFG